MSSGATGLNYRRGNATTFTCEVIDAPLRDSHNPGMPLACSHGDLQMTRLHRIRAFALTMAMLAALAASAEGKKAGQRAGNVNELVVRSTVDSSR
jgi:hypothetical protein